MKLMRFVLDRLHTILQIYFNYESNRTNDFAEMRVFLFNVMDRIR